MIAWWEDIEQGNGTVPVSVDNRNFKVTCYVKKAEKTLVVLADFNNNGGNYSDTISLSVINWAALGLSPATAKLTVPSLTPFQTLNTGE